MCIRKCHVLVMCDMTYLFACHWPSCVHICMCTYICIHFCVYTHNICWWWVICRMTIRHWHSCVYIYLVTCMCTRLRVHIQIMCWWCVTWRIHVRAMTHWSSRAHICMCSMYMYILMQLCVYTHIKCWWCVTWRFRVRVPWLIYMCDMTHAYVWHALFVCVTGRPHLCGMTGSWLMTHDLCHTNKVPW